MPELVRHTRLSPRCNPSDSAPEDVAGNLEKETNSHWNCRSEVPTPAASHTFEHANHQQQFILLKTIERIVIAMCFYKKCFPLFHFANPSILCTHLAVEGMYLVLQRQSIGEADVLWRHRRWTGGRSGITGLTEKRAKKESPALIYTATVQTHTC
jgi:hypothetical protein